MAVSPTLELAMALMRCASVTPDDAGCQERLIARLEPLGFEVERMRHGEVDNFWARRGTERPLLVFAGHTDVVPPGPLEQWSSPPFEPTLRGEHLYGRGAADMKGSLAAMITACERFLGDAGERAGGSIGFLITSDEEGPAVDGTARVVRALSARAEQIDYCLVGEPSSHERLGDVIKNGRRGSFHGRLRVQAEPQSEAATDRDLPVSRLNPALVELCEAVWDEGSPYFAPTSFQVSNLHTASDEDGVARELEARFNFRFSPAVTAEDLSARVHAILDRHRVRYDLEWTLSGKPFITGEGELVAAIRTAIEQTTGYAPRLSTTGGTSDGRFIAPTGAQVAELGPVNASIHKVDEHVRVADLDTLSTVYERMLARLLGPRDRLEGVDRAQMQ